MRKIIFFLFIANLMVAQEIEFTGKLLDKNTKEPVVYANISFLNSNKGISSNEDGSFSMVIPDKLLKDKVHISCLNYKDTIVFAKNLHNKAVYLQHKSIMLDEIKISKKNKKKIFIDKVKKKVTPFHTVNLRMIAKFFPNTLKEEFFINKVKIHFSKRNSHKAKFRIRLFSFDENTGKPKEDILNKSIPILIEKGQKFVEIDLEEYYLELPKSGIFVVFEKLLIPYNLYTWEYSVKGKHDYYAPVIGMTVSKKYRKQNRVLFFNRGKWHFMPFPMDDYKYVPAIELELSN